MELRYADPDMQALVDGEIDEFEFGQRAGIRHFEHMLKYMTRNGTLAAWYDLLNDPEELDGRCAASGWDNEELAQGFAWGYRGVANEWLRAYGYEREMLHCQHGRTLIARCSSCLSENDWS
jgi:hypothetical protein